MKIISMSSTEIISSKIFTINYMFELYYLYCVRVHVAFGNIK